MTGSEFDLVKLGLELPSFEWLAGVCCRVERVTPTSSRAGSGEAGVIARPAGDARQRPTTEMSEDELRRKTKSIIDEYLHLNDLKVLSSSSHSLMTTFTSLIHIHLNDLKVLSSSSHSLMTTLKVLFIFT